MRKPRATWRRLAELLRRKGIAKAEKRAGRSASQGLVVIDLAADGKSGGMIELNCETDFVAKTDDFIALANDLAKHVAAQAPVGVKAGSIDDQAFRGAPRRGRQGSVRQTGEAMSLARYARFTEAAGVVASYLHHNGQVGVLVDVEGPAGPGLVALAKDVALHIASADPIGVTETDIPSDLIDRERRIAEEQVAAEGKPEAIRGKIVDGKIKKFVAERVLVGQPFVKDDSKTAGELIAAAAKDLGGSVTVSTSPGSRSERPDGAAYRRALLKISGEALAGDRGIGLLRSRRRLAVPDQGRMHRESISAWSWAAAISCAAPRPAGRGSTASTPTTWGCSPR
ncbi:MAG: translation elongation factor Ts [Gemmatimonadales bacterium]